MQIKQICKPIVEKVNHLLSEALGKGDEALFLAAKHVLNAGGKRVRPLLVLLSTYDLGGDIEEAYWPAVALELVHNYSLVHDDLPCMDDDDERRGQPTVHKAFDEATAVLCGDYLLTLAFNILTQNVNVEDSAKLKLIEKLSHFSGGSELILGQSMDLLTPSGSLDELKEIYQKKTSSLFICALEFGGIISGVSDSTLSTLEQIGEKLGLAFQIENDFAKKKTEEGKFTVLSLLDNKGAKLYQKKLISEARDLMDSLEVSMPLTKDYLGELFSEV